MASKKPLSQPKATSTLTLSESTAHVVGCAICSSPASSLSLRQIRHVLRYLPTECEWWELTDCQALALALTSYYGRAAQLPPPPKFWLEGRLTAADHLECVTQRELTADLLRLVIRYERQRARRKRAGSR